MITMKRSVFLSFVSFIVIIFFFSVISIPSYGDVQIGSEVKVIGTEGVPPIMINMTTNSTSYKGATFAWYPENGTIQGQYFNFTATLRIHQNWNNLSLTDIYYLNVMQIVDLSNASGSFNLTMIHTAKQANNVLGSSETNNLTMYIKHGYQSLQDLGTFVPANSTTGPYTLYHLPEVSYYIGFNYTRPPDTANSVGQYFNLSFNFVISL